MKLTTQDYLLARAGMHYAFLLKTLGDIETRSLQKPLADIGIRAPVFVTGLARSGTTILLSVLAGLPGFATHRYRDFPFVFTPVFWSRYMDRFAHAAEASERPHRDGIRITLESPDAFEEPIWQYFFPHLHDRRSIHILNEQTSNTEFETFFREHLRKIMLLRGGNRYLSKGNYNITRIAYLARLFPDARFLIPVRHPLGHVESLVRQHRLFSGYAQDDARIGRYLQAAGHYEFGPQRVAIRLDAEMARQIERHWQAGRDHAGYAVQWAGIYRHAQTLLENPALRDRIMILRFEDLCDRPAAILQQVLEFLEVPDCVQQAAALAPAISPPGNPAGSPVTETADSVRAITAAVAETLGYSD